MPMKWIRVQDDMPRPHTRVFAAEKCGNSFVIHDNAHFTGERWERASTFARGIPYSDLLCNITHWMPRLETPDEHNTMKYMTPPEWIRVCGTDHAIVDVMKLTKDVKLELTFFPNVDASVSVRASWAVFKAIKDTNQEHKIAHQIIPGDPDIDTAHEIAIKEAADWLNGIAESYENLSQMLTAQRKATS